MICVPPPQYERSKAAYDILTSSTDAKDRTIEVVKMPLPPPQFITPVRLCSQTNLRLLQVIRMMMVRSDGVACCTGGERRDYEGKGSDAPRAGDAAGCLVRF